METKVAIIEKIESKQKILQLNYVAFAKKLGISRQLWAAIKAGRRKPGYKLFKAVMRELPELTLDVMAAMRDQKEPTHES
jgi:predicted transcriptional regulator